MEVTLPLGISQLDIDPYRETDLDLVGTRLIVARRSRKPLILLDRGVENVEGG